MSASVNPLIAATEAPPVMEARRWLDGVAFTPERPLINVSQAAPTDAPPLALREAIAEAALNDPGAHLYGPVLGLPELRAELAAQWSRAYAAPIGANQVAITSGCNQAFCAALATLAQSGDEIILPVPWYFNHKMWCDAQAIRTVPLATGADMLPDPEEAARLITARTRAIVLVTPNNPSGAEYPADLVGAFFDLARAHSIALILDETYRDFDARSGAPHSLFSRDGWDATLIHLYSFSKAYRLTGHRVGAMVGAPARLAEVEKFLDAVAICPNQLGQRAALWGMRNLADWLAGERAEILSRRAAMQDGFTALKGWRLLGCGAYFAYVEHPFDTPSGDLAPLMVRGAGILLLPGTMFAPAPDAGGDGRAQHQLRIAFANIGAAEIADLFQRLAAFSP